MIDVASLHACRRCRVVLRKDDDEWRHVKGRGDKRYIDCCKPCHAAEARESVLRRRAEPGGLEREREIKRASNRRCRERDPEAWRERRARDGRERRKRNRRRVRATQRRSYKRRMADPDYRAFVAIEQRMRRLDRARAEGREPRKHRPRNGIDLYMRKLSDDEHFDPTPFLDWLDETYPGLAHSDVARRLDIADSTLGKLVDGRMHTVSLNYVDRAFVNYGRPDLLNVLYPLKEKRHAR